LIERKNKMKWVLICLLPIVSATAQETETNVVEKAATEATSPTAEDRIAELLGTVNDPFRLGYSRESGSLADHLIPVDVNSLTVAVRVKGILLLEHGTPAALVQVGADPRPQLVREQDLILLPDGSSGIFGSKKKPSDSSRYLLVTRILRDSILVAPKKSPETVITIR
jgi:hypothetical protein